MKISLAVAGVVLLGSTLAACGGSDGSDGGGSTNGGDASGGGGDYCQDIKAAKKTFSGVTGSSAAGLEDAFATFHKLADEAPSDVKDDWKVLDEAATTIEDGFKEAGIKLSDLDDIQAGKLPEGLDASKLTSLATKLSDLTGQKFTDAQEAIAKQALADCKVDLKGS